MAGGSLTNAVTFRLDDQDYAGLKAAAGDLNHSPGAMMRHILQKYLAGYKGPYVLQIPLTEADQ